MYELSYRGIEQNPKCRGKIDGIYVKTSRTDGWRNNHVTPEGAMSDDR